MSLNYAAVNISILKYCQHFQILLHEMARKWQVPQFQMPF